MLVCVSVFICVFVYVNVCVCLCVCVCLEVFNEKRSIIQQDVTILGQIFRGTFLES